MKKFNLSHLRSVNPGAGPDVRGLIRRRNKQHRSARINGLHSCAAGTNAGGYIKANE